MTSGTRSSLLLGAALALTAPSMLAQQASIAVSATVRSRPLMLVGAALTAIPGELRVRLDGCGAGALSVDLRAADGTRRISHALLHATASCATRSVLLQLPTREAGSRGEFVVTLEQSEALTSPAFAQFVLPVSALGGRTSEVY